MSRLWNNRLVKNRFGQVRSGWIILIAMVAYDRLSLVSSIGIIEVLRKILIATGDINPATGEVSGLVDWFNDVSLPVAFQILTDVLMLAVPIVIWRLVMKHSVREMGLDSLSCKQSRKDGAAGMLLGIVNCSVIFLLVLTIGKGRIVSDGITVSGLTFWWLVAFVLVGIAEEDRKSVV